MKTTLMIPLVVLLCASACDRRFEFKARPDESSYLRTDSAMIGNENQANKSSTSVGIPGF